MSKDTEIKVPKVHFGGDYHTAQIYSMGYEFAFLGRKTKKGPFHQATPFVYCKDFLHDAVWAFLNKSSIKIYSFIYDYATSVPLCLDRTVLAFRNAQFKGDKESEFHSRLEPCLEFLQLADRALGFRPTQIYPVPHEGGPCWMILADGRWQHAPTMVSLFSLFVRVGCFHKPGDTLETTISRAAEGEVKVGDSSHYAGNKDGSYVKSGRKGIDCILEHGLGVFHDSQMENYPPELKDKGLHDNYGIVNFTAGRPKSVMPHWYRREIWGKK